MTDFEKRLTRNFAHADEDTRPRSLNGYLMDSLDELKEEIRLAREKYTTNPKAILSFCPDRSKSSEQISSDLKNRLREMGLSPQDILVRYVEGQQYVHKPTASTIGENSLLAMSIGVGEHIATWASPFYESSKIHLGSDVPASDDRAYIIYEASDLIRVDRVGDKDVERPFYVFKGNPHDSILIKIHDGAELDLDQRIGPSVGKREVRP